MQPNAKKLILGLLLANEDRPLSVRNAIAACTLFRITENNVRVTLVRLSAEGLIESRGRGAYGLGPAARSMADAVAHWHRAEESLRPWSGQYIVVSIGALGRSDRKALRQRERALQMLGLRALDRGLHLRPDNFSGGVAVVRQRLRSLGLEREALVFVAEQFDPEREKTIEKLWDGAELNRRYLDQNERLQAWLARHQELEADVAARESYLLGGEAIRQVVFDPWLPEPFVDANARHEFVATVRKFDETGKQIWSGLFAEEGAMPLASVAAPGVPGRLQ